VGVFGGTADWLLGVLAVVAVSVDDCFGVDGSLLVFFILEN